MATPEGAIIPAELQVEEEQQPSLTYGIDFEKGREVGMIDVIEAVKQAVFLILKTERSRYLRYTADYGSELEGLIGRDRLFVQSELKRRIREALMRDDRIEDVTNFRLQFNGDRVLVRFTVISNFGEIEMEQEVTTVV